jgi:galactokinase
VIDLRAPDASVEALCDAAAVAGRAAAHGWSPAAAAWIGQRTARCAAAIVRRSGTPDATASAFCVPGRIEVLGKHTDYAGGRSLLACVERGIAIVAARGVADAVTILDADHGRRIGGVWDALPGPRRGDWSNHVLTVLRRAAADFGPLYGGIDIAFSSTLPPAAGLSSSSALVVALFAALACAYRLGGHARFRAAIHDAEHLAAYLAAVENGRAFRDFDAAAGVGTDGGSQDHTAALCGQRDAIVRYAFLPTRFEGSASLPDGRTFVIACSGVAAEKAGAARERYNRTAALAHEAAALWRRRTGGDAPHLGAIGAAGAAATDRLRAVVREASGGADTGDRAARVDQFLAETLELVPAAFAALANGDIADFGEVVDRSQLLAETKLGNQIDETVFLQRTARSLGADAASAFGAGFGGAVWALVGESDAASFARAWRSAYVERWPEHATASAFFVTRAGPAAGRTG